jgi:hypothetical protein
MSGVSRVITYARPSSGVRTIGTAENQQETIALLRAIKEENEELKTIIIQLRDEFDQIKRFQTTCNSYLEHPVVSDQIEQLTEKVNSQIQENKIQSEYCKMFAEYIQAEQESNDASRNDLTEYFESINKYIEQQENKIQSEYCKMFAKYIQAEQESNDASRNDLTEYFESINKYIEQQAKQNDDQNKETREYCQNNKQKAELILDKIGESFGVIFLGIHLILRFCSHIIFVMTFYLSWKTDTKKNQQSEKEREQNDFFQHYSAFSDNFYQTTDAFTNNVQVLKNDLLRQSNFKSDFNLNQLAQKFSPLSTHNFFFVEEASAEYIPQT